MKSTSLSVVLNTKNSEQFLEAALKSVAFADEIIVVDMQSTDATKSIAKKYTSHVFNHKDVGYVEPARNFAIGKATKEWILILDADEEILPTLKEKLQDIIKNPAADAYYIPRLNEVFGHQMQKTGWWPDYQLRIFKKGVVSWDDTIHSVPTVQGKVAYIEQKNSLAILHHNYQSISQFVERMNRYTDIQSEYLRDDHPGPAAIVTAFKDELMSRLFKFRGIDEGMHGVSLSFLQSFYSILLVLKKWESQGFKKTSIDQRKTLKALKAMQKDISYWIADYEAEHKSGFNKMLSKIKRKLHS